MREFFDKYVQPAATIFVVVGVAWLVVTGSYVSEEPIARSYNTSVYTEQGGAKLVVASGGEIEVQSGGTIDIQSGATTDYSGGVDLDGALLDLDADGDTSLQSDTDDQIDVEIGGADIVVLNEWGSSTVTTDTTEHLVEILDTTNVLSAGTNSLAALNIDLGIGNSTGGTNSVYGLLVDGITADAENTETAISLGSGWDVGLDAGTNTIVNVGAAGTDFGSDGSLTTAAGITISDGNATVADDFIIVAQTAISATDGGVITPTGTYQQLESAAEVTPTVTTSGVTAGTLLVLINTANTTINLADSGTMMLTAAAALGQYDSLTLWFDGTNWIEVSRANN